MPHTRKPSNAEQLTTYEQLRFYARNFALGNYNCLIFVGPPGQLKSSILEEETKGRAHMISGHATPFEVFCECQEHANQMLIIDDADGLYKEAAGQRLLKNLTNPKSPKTVYWTSDAPTHRGLAKTFQTTSRVCIIDNAWNTQNEHIAALEDRSRLFLFDPTPDEVHLEMERQDWFHDDEVYQFIGENLTFIKDLSARLYVKAEEAKRASEDWRRYILKQFVKDAELAVILIEYDPAFRPASVAEKAAEFMRRTGLGRTSYQNHKRNLMLRMAGHTLVGRWSLTPDPAPEQA